MGTLFDVEIPKDNSPIEDVDITTTILYMSTVELKEFKILAKQGIKKMFGSEFQQKGNLTDYILELIRKDNNIEVPLPYDYKLPFCGKIFNEEINENYVKKNNE